MLFMVEAETGKMIGEKQVDDLLHQPTASS
jgi:hypothetical protein